MANVSYSPRPFQKFGLLSVHRGRFLPFRGQNVEPRSNAYPVRPSKLQSPGKPRAAKEVLGELEAKRALRGGGWLARAR